MPERKTYPVNVNYDASLEELMRAANFNYINSGVSDKSFPVDIRGQVTINVTLFSYDEMRTTKEIIDDLTGQGMRLCNIKELVAFSIDHPDEQRSGPIIAFGTIWKRAEGEEVVPVLRGGKNDRNMHLLRTANDWTPCERIAVTNVTVFEADDTS